MMIINLSPGDPCDGEEIDDRNEIIPNKSSNRRTAGTIGTSRQGLSAQRCADKPVCSQGVMSSNRYAVKHGRQAPEERLVRVARHQPRDCAAQRTAAGSPAIARLNRSIIARLNAGMSSGRRLVTNP